MRIRLVYILLLLSASVFSCTSDDKGEDGINESALNVKIEDTNVVLPPAWAFGVLYGGYTNQKQTIETIKKIQQHDYPIDAYWIDSWFWSFNNKGRGPGKYIDFIADTVSYPDRKVMWDFLEQNNIKGGFWVWDCILETGNEAAYNEFDSLGYFSSKFLNTNPWHNNSTTTAMFENEGKHPGTWCGNIDFTNPEAVTHFKNKIKPFFDDGADFLKLDRTSAVSVVRVMFEISQELGKETKGRGFVLSHSGDTDDEEFKRYPAKWTDDTRSDWSVEVPTKEFNTWVPKVALKENIAMFTDPENKTSKIPFLTNDTGGFDMGKTNEIDEELYIRWVQFSAFNPIMEVFSQPENPTRNLAFNYSEKADSIFRKYSHLRMELFPYIYSYAIASRVEGVNMIRPVSGYLYEFNFGDELLVAPVYEQSAKHRKVFLPGGNWVNFWSGERLEGGKLVNAKAPLEIIPLFVKEGAIIPMRPYAGSIEAGTNDLMTLHVFPGANGKFKFYEDDGISNEYLNGKISEIDIQLIDDGDSFKLIIAPLKGTYKGMPQKRNWQVAIHTSEKYTEMYIGGKKHDLTQEGNVVKSGIFTDDISNKIIVEIK